jgi:hypothetical protein
MPYGLFGISWVMPRSVLGMLHCWQGKFGRHRNIGVWRAVPHCLMWCLWWECNGHSFEDYKRTLVELKVFFFFFELYLIRCMLGVLFLIYS